MPLLSLAHRYSSVDLLPPLACNFSTNGSQTRIDSRARNEADTSCKLVRRLDESYLSGCWVQYCKYIGA